MNGSDAKPVRLVTGALLNCLACRHGEFTTRTVQLGGGAPSPLGLEWSNQSSTCYICGRCGHVHWFMPPDRKPLQFTVPKPEK